jgi:phosphate transport system protein
MSQHFVRSLVDLNRAVLEVGALVEESINKAILALVNRRADLAREVIAGDDDIDKAEISVEEMCLQILALHQPVAHDLRFIVSVLKVNSDLERMGDLAANIAERALTLAQDPPLVTSVDLTNMAEHVRAMTRDVLNALVNLDAGLARQVCAHDDIVDRLNHEQREALTRIMHDRPEDLDRAMLTLFASRHLERIADHAVNIAEDVVYMVEGEVIRHSRPAQGVNGRVDSVPPTASR